MKMQKMNPKAKPKSPVNAIRTYKLISIVIFVTSDNLYYVFFEHPFSVSQYHLGHCGKSVRFLFHLSTFFRSS